MSPAANAIHFKNVIKSVLMAGLFAALAAPAGAQMHRMGDIMTPGGFPAGYDSKDAIARDQKAANNWNNAGKPQNELTVSQGGKLPDPMIIGGSSGGGGAGNESPVASAKSYVKYPSGTYNMGSNHNDAVGLADGLQPVGQPAGGLMPGAAPASRLAPLVPPLSKLLPASGSGLVPAAPFAEMHTGGGGGQYVPAGYSGQGNVYGSYAGSHYANAGLTAPPPAILPASPQAVNSIVAGTAASSACCRGNLPCCKSRWPCCPGAAVGNLTGATGTGQAGRAAMGAGLSSGAGAGVLSPGLAGGFLPGIINGLRGTNQFNQGPNNLYDPNNEEIVTPPETEPLMGPPQVFGGLSAPMAANMRDLMTQSGLTGPQGGKMLGAAESGILGLASSFQQLKAANMPGASSEQAKVNQNAVNGQTADNLAGMEREQAATAIDFVRTYLVNFTSNSSNKWNALRNNLFVPMAILLLLPGAVLAQVKAIVSQGFSVLGDVNPWDGIVRSMVAVFLIPATYLIMNYGIDVANSFTQTIGNQYFNIFHTDMYEDAFAGHVRAFPIRLPEENYSVIPNIPASMYNMFGNSPLARLEGRLLAVKYQDPAAGLYVVPKDRANETVPFLVTEARLMYNRINAAQAFAWTILCAAQECYLYYLWFVGPIVAALWTYPMGQLRQAFPNWVEGVVSLCFWSFFWSTTILLMACFRGVDDTGTIVFTALNMLALGSVKFAFDISGLVKDAGREAGNLAERTSRLLAESGMRNGGSGVPGIQPGVQPRINPDADPRMIDPMNPSYPINPTQQQSSSSSNSLHDTSIATAGSGTAAGMNLLESAQSMTRDSVTPALSTLSSGQVSSPIIDHPGPPLSGQGASASGAAGAGNATRAEQIAATYAAVWGQSGTDRLQGGSGQSFDAGKINVNGTAYAEHDLAAREQADRAYQEQQQEKRKEQERQTQQALVQADNLAWQQRQEMDRLTQNQQLAMQQSAMQQSAMQQPEQSRQHHAATNVQGQQEAQVSSNALGSQLAQTEARWQQQHAGNAAGPLATGLQALPPGGQTTGSQGTAAFAPDSKSVSQPGTWQDVNPASNVASNLAGLDAGKSTTGDFAAPAGPHSTSQFQVSTGAADLAVSSNSLGTGLPPAASGTLPDKVLPPEANPDIAATAYDGGSHPVQESSSASPDIASTAQASRQQAQHASIEGLPANVLAPETLAANHFGAGASDADPQTAAAGQTAAAEAPGAATLKTLSQLISKHQSSESFVAGDDSSPLSYLDLG